MIDLHAHSTFSDGTLTPELLASRGVEMGLTALALTDHDTTGGLERFISACSDGGLRGVPGVEISANVHKGTLHILGYFIRSDDEFEGMLRQIRDGRDERNTRMVKNLNELGLEVALDEVAGLAGGDVVGRLHFAYALIKKGYVKNKEDAFKRYLAKGRPGYAERFRLSAEDSIAAISGAGGVPVLAHPFTLEMGKSELSEYVGGLAKAGLRGIEVYYPEHKNEHILQYLQLAGEFGLAVTGGSDFHGEAVNPRLRLGVGFGGLNVSDELLGKLEAVCRK